MSITDQQQEASKSLFDHASEPFFEAIKAQLKCTFSSICSDPETIDLFPEHARGRSRSMIVDRRLLFGKALNELKDVDN